jgi:Predicted AAA-ATPase/PD-(D/E)XK nuclease superfamily
LVDSSGFLRSFYAAIKAFAGTNTVARTFITGVSPIVLDDLSSGFNIIKHISQHPHFNEMAGFTRAEVERAVDLMIASKPDITRDPRLADREALLSTLEEYYDGYRFAPEATQRMYNATLVLYFFSEVMSRGTFPRTMLDLNARTDYGRLYGLAKAATEHESGIRPLLEQALSQGEVRMPLVEQFGTRFPLAAAQVTSLFYYMGMLTFGPDAAKETIPTLVIPNRVMRELQWEYMGYALADNERIVVDMTYIEQALLAMAEEGDIQPLLQVFTKEVLERISNRDLGKFNEKIMKLMLLAYLCQTRVFHVAGELEMKQGYCDLLLGLRSATMREKFAWIIEAKYVAMKATPQTHEKAIADGYAQIDKYMGDQGVVNMLTLGREIKSGVMVFVGAKRIDWYPWPKPEKTTVKRKATAKKTARKA